MGCEDYSETKLIIEMIILRELNSAIIIQNLESQDLRQYKVVGKFTIIIGKGKGNTCNRNKSCLTRFSIIEIFTRFYRTIKQGQFIRLK